MFYQSLLTLDLGNDPARPRPTRQIIRNQYLLHQRVYAAFGQQPLEDEEKGIKKRRGENHNWLLFRVMLTPPNFRLLVSFGKRTGLGKCLSRHWAAKRLGFSLLPSGRGEGRTPV